MVIIMFIRIDFVFCRYMEIISFVSKATHKMWCFFVKINKTLHDKLNLGFLNLFLTKITNLE